MLTGTRNAKCRVGVIGAQLTISSKFGYRRGRETMNWTPLFIIDVTMGIRGPSSMSYRIDTALIILCTALCSFPVPYYLVFHVLSCQRQRFKPTARMHICNQKAIPP